MVSIVDFLSLLLSSNSKSYDILETQLQTSSLVNKLLSKQKNSYSSYQPLIESCNAYNKSIKKHMHKIRMQLPSNQYQNPNDNRDASSPIAIQQSTTSSIPTNSVNSTSSLPTIPNAANYQQQYAASQYHQQPHMYAQNPFSPQVQAVPAPVSHPASNVTKFCSHHEYIFNVTISRQQQQLLAMQQMYGFAQI